MASGPRGDTTRHRTRLAYLVGRAERDIRAQLDEVTGRHGLTTPKYTALSVLGQASGLSSAELARTTFVTPQAMHPLVSALEAEGLVVRRPDPEHARILRTWLTRRGRRVLGACDREVDALEARALRGFATSELEQLRSLLRRFSANLTDSSATGEDPARTGSHRA